MRLVASALAAVAVALVVDEPAARGAGAATRLRGPCTGCLASLPAGTEPRPLLVLLHGDGEGPATMLAAWETAAAARGIVVFAPACPRDEGCTSGSWWKWDGAPTWLLRQVDALAATRPIDRTRAWIAGWSGGATYVAWHTQELERAFAAIVLHGGGVRPRDAACASPRAAVYFLGGDANPLHYLTDDLRAHYALCGQELTWNVVPGADHAAERAALAPRREAILDWLEAHHR
jgi:poly(3-hydroxybutyrate) depolymerase